MVKLRAPEAPSAFGQTDGFRSRFDSAECTTKTIHMIANSLLADWARNRLGESHSECQVLAALILYLRSSALSLKSSTRMLAV